MRKNEAPRPRWRVDATRSLIGASSLIPRASAPFGAANPELEIGNSAGRNLRVMDQDHFRR